MAAQNRRIGDQPWVRRSLIGLALNGLIRLSRRAGLKQTTVINSLLSRTTRSWRAFGPLLLPSSHYHRRLPR